MAKGSIRWSEAILQGVVTGVCVGVFRSIDSLSAPAAIGLAVVVSIPVFLAARYLLFGGSSGESSGEAG
ncbi:MAG: hypothetical protein AAF266_15075 [Planctomycetota bacterium]